MALQGVDVRIILANDANNQQSTRAIIRYGISEAHSPNKLTQQQCRVTTHKEYKLKSGDIIQILDIDGNTTEQLRITTPGQIQAALRTHLAVTYVEN